MKRLFSIVIDTVWVVCLYYGLVHGIEGALNVGLFLTWFMFIVSFGLFSKEVAETAGEIPVWAIARSLIFDLAAIGMLAWHGWIITAAVATWACMIGFGAWASNRKGKAA